VKFPVTVEFYDQRAKIYAPARNFPFYRVAFKVAGKRRMLTFGTANEYLKRRAKRAGPGTDGEAGESNLAIGLESIKASASGQPAADIAEKWLHDARLEAIESDAEQWEQWREESGVT
jgi:hypothetical protein